MDHPEVVEEMQEAMRRGLTAESILTPTQIRDRVRQSLKIHDKPIRKAKDLVAEVVVENCSCGRAGGYTLGMLKDGRRVCYPWCESTEHVEFRTEPELDYNWPPNPYGSINFR